MWPFRNNRFGRDRVFVSIASFCDPELPETLRDLFSKAASPDKLRVVVCLQDREEVFLRLNQEFGEKVKFLFVPAEESKGCCWARHLIQKQLGNEAFYCQLDSHHRFEHHWDAISRKFLMHCGSDKPILTSYLPSYDPGSNARDNKPYLLRGEYFYDNDKLRIQPVALDEPDFHDKPLPGHLLSAHFIFTHSRWVREVPYDENMYFEGEEDTLTIRSYTHGWDLYHPHRIIAYHHYTRTGELRHHDIEPEWHKLHEVALRRMRILTGMEEGNIAAPYGLGDKRTLQEYEQRSGIWFRQRIVSDSQQSLIRRQSLWQHSHGYFKRTEERKWAEYQNEQITAEYAEVDHTPGMLILWDPNKMIWIKLMQNDGWFKQLGHEGSTEWVCFTQGAWNVTQAALNQEAEEARIRRISVVYEGKKPVSVITMKTPNTEDWAFSSEINHKGYCRQWGYTLTIYKDLPLVHEFPHWNKVYLWQRHLADSEWLLWIDSDAIFTRPDLPLEHITDMAEGKDLLVCDDIGGWTLNTGVVFMKNSPWMRDILTRLWAMEHIPHSKAAEQSSLISLLGIRDPDKEHWKVFPQKSFNTHPRTHEDGDFILHMMGLSGAERLKTFTYWNNRIGYK